MSLQGNLRDIKDLETSERCGKGQLRGQNSPKETGKNRVGSPLPRSPDGDTLLHDLVRQRESDERAKDNPVLPVDLGDLVSKTLGLSKGPLYLPRTMRTSSSLRMGMERT